MCPLILNLLSASPKCMYHHCSVASSQMCRVVDDLGSLPIDYLYEIRLYTYVFKKNVSDSVDFLGFPETSNSNEFCFPLSMTSFFLSAHNSSYGSWPSDSFFTALKNSCMCIH